MTEAPKKPSIFHNMVNTGHLIIVGSIAVSTISSAFAAGFIYSNLQSTQAQETLNRIAAESLETTSRIAGEALLRQEFSGEVGALTEKINKVQEVTQTNLANIDKSLTKLDGSLQALIDASKPSHR